MFPSWLRLNGFVKPIEKTASSNLEVANSYVTPEDQASAELWVHTWSTEPKVRDLQKVTEVLGSVYPLKVSSVFRPSGTHQELAVDLAPIDLGRYGHPLGIDPRLYARPVVLRRILSAILGLPFAGNVQILVEDNHFHLNLKDNGHLPAGFPREPVVVQINPRKGYRRSEADALQDVRLMNQGNWIPVTESMIHNLPQFIQRF